MRIYKEVVKKVVDEILCDCCGQSCTKESPTETPSYCNEYASIEATWGYFSEQDGTQYSIEICEHCFNEVLASMKKIRKRILEGCVSSKSFYTEYQHKADPLSGRNYLT